MLSFGGFVVNCCCFVVSIDCPSTPISNSELICIPNSSRKAEVEIQNQVKGKRSVLNFCCPVPKGGKSEEKREGKMVVQVSKGKEKCVREVENVRRKCPSVCPITPRISSNYHPVAPSEFSSLSTSIASFAGPSLSESASGLSGR
jgi:hypothetical protein